MWVKLDDGFATNPKVLGVRPVARLLYVYSLCYAARELTDGFVPAALAPAIVALAGGDEDDPAALVGAGLWEPAVGGYRIHDWHQYNPTAEAVREERRRNAERQAAWRERHGVSDESRDTNVGSNGVSAAAPVPVPVPVPVPDPVIPIQTTEPPVGRSVGGRHLKAVQHRIEVIWHEAMGNAAPRRLSARQLAAAAAIEGEAAARGIADVIGRAADITAGRGLDGNHWSYFLGVARRLIEEDGSGERGAGSGQVAGTRRPGVVGADSADWYERVRMRRDRGEELAQVVLHELARWETERNGAATG